MSYFTELAQQYIDGSWRPGRGAWDIIDFNPYNGEKLAAITVASADEVDEAYRAAERAQKSWADTNPYTRRMVFERALRLVEEREDEISDAIVDELGGTRLKAGFELHLAKEFLRESIQLALRPQGRVIPSPVDGKENRVYRVPVGVVGVISPFNFPFLLSLKSVAPALALGNGVVLKPHQNTPICGGSLVAKILEDAGLLGRSAQRRHHRHRRDRRRVPHPPRAEGHLLHRLRHGGPARRDGVRLAVQARRPGAGRQQRTDRARRRGRRLRRRRRGLQPVRAPGPGVYGRQPDPGGPQGGEGVHREVRRQGQVPQGGRPPRPVDRHRSGHQLHAGGGRFGRRRPGARGRRDRAAARQGRRQSGRAERPDGPGKPTPPCCGRRSSVLSRSSSPSTGTRRRWPSRTTPRTG